MDIAQKLLASQAAIGHLKFIISGDGVEQKLSLPTLEEPGWRNAFPMQLGGQAKVLVNARVEMDAQDLRDLFSAALAQCGALVNESGVDYFHPKQPNPQHRLE